MVIASMPFVSFRTMVRNPLYGCFASLSMTRWRIANLTLWSLSFNKERDVLAKAKTG
jgi:hypothetical protein